LGVAWRCCRRSSVPRPAVVAPFSTTAAAWSAQPRITPPFFSRLTPDVTREETWNLSSGIRLWYFDMRCSTALFSKRLYHQ
jgi:hypothetical protein